MYAKPHRMWYLRHGSTPLVESRGNGRKTLFRSCQEHLEQSECVRDCEFHGACYGARVSPRNEPDCVRETAWSMVLACEVVFAIPPAIVTHSQKMFWPICRVTISGRMAPPSRAVRKCTWLPRARNFAAEHDLACHQAQNCEATPLNVLRYCCIGAEKDNYNKLYEQLDKCLKL